SLLSRSAMRNTLLAALSLVLAAGLLSCKREDQPGDRDGFRFEVDAEGVTYAYFDPHSGPRVTSTVDAIPLAQRGAVRIHAPERADTSDRRSVFVADLLGASPGERRRAVPMSEPSYRARTTDLADAHRLARAVAFTAREAAKLAPTSDRRRVSGEALRTFDRMLPALAEPDAGGATPADAGTQPAPTHRTERP
ncbi:MAG: hypothetical protein ABEL76_05445, partial [Bradymonadaceae bacterium]